MLLLLLGWRGLVEDRVDGPGLEGVAVVVGERREACAAAGLGRGDELAANAAWARAAAEVGVAPAQEEEGEGEERGEHGEAADGATYDGARAVGRVG